MIAIKVQDLTFRYAQSNQAILNHLDFEVEAGKITAILGASGSGKSTLSRCLCGLIPRAYSGDYSGDVFLYGEKLQTIPMDQLVSQIGIVFQNPATQLFSPTIEDELAFGPENLCIPRDIIEQRMGHLLKIIGMESYRHCSPLHLSGGQQQLIALAAVLMMEPKVLICDEIMSWVDAAGKAIIRDLLKNLRDQGTTVILVDHDIDNTEIADHWIRL